MKLVRGDRGLGTGGPIGEVALELAACPLLRVLAFEALLHRLPYGVPTRATLRLLLEIEGLPASIELDDGREDRTGCARYCFQLGEYRIRFTRMVLMAKHCFETIARETRHAAILVSRALGDAAQPLGRVDALGGSHASVRDIRA